MSGRWLFDQTDRSVWIESDSQRVKPSFLEIWESEFEGRTLLGRMTVGRPSDDLPSLEFREGFADLWLTTLAIPGGQVVLVHVDEYGETLELPHPEVDQVVVQGVWHPIDINFERNRNERLAGLGVIVGTPLSMSNLLSLSKTNDLRIQVVIEQVRKAFTSDETTSIELAGMVKAELYPYQSSGVRFLSRIANEGIGGLLGDEMGLGKTLQVISLMALETRAGRPNNLVVCPATLVRNWTKEIERFAPSLRVLSHAGGDRSGISKGLEGSDIVVTTYETLVRDLYLFSAINWNVVAIDEAQSIKNPDSRRSVAVKRIPRRVSIAVTGTPVENTLRDLWSIMEFVLPEYLGDRASFEASFPDIEEPARVLGASVAPVVLRRLVSDVADDLPGKIIVSVPLVMGAELGREYELLRNDPDVGSAGQRLALMTRLRKFCCVQDTFSGREKHPQDQKLAVTLSLALEIALSGGKAIIFSTFRDASDLIVTALREAMPSALVGEINGDVLIGDRQPIVDGFNDFSEAAFLVINPQAGGTGLNIQGANHVIHFNPVWNPAVEDQATARAYRRGQKRPVTIHRLYYEGTVEETMVARLESKRSLSGSALEAVELQGDDIDLAGALAMSPSRLSGYPG